MKKQNFKSELDALLMSWHKKPFVWGDHDCVLCAAKVVEVVTGIENALPSWETEEQADAYIESNGGLQIIVERYLGQAVNWGQCGAGDIVLYNFEGRQALAIHDGAQLVGPGLRGLKRVPFDQAIIGWVL